MNRRLVLLLLAAALLTPLLGAGLAASDTLDARRREVEGLSPEALAELARQQVRFAALDAQEQSRLRRLDAELATDPDREELRRVMRSYHEWLRSLEPSEREELRRLKPAERVDRVKALRRQQAERAALLLSEADREAVFGWLEARVRERATADQVRLWDGMAVEFRRAAIYGEVWKAQFGMRGRKVLKPDDIASLRERLSPESQEQLDACDSDNDRQKMAGGWIWQAMFPGGFRQGGPAKRPSADELQRFFESRLTPDEQRQLLLLRPEQRQRHLWTRYQQVKERDRAWRELESLLPPEPPADGPPAEKE